MKITLSPQKTFIAFPSVQLLGQNVSLLGMTAADDKLKVILELEFPVTLADLDTYLGLTGWLRNYVPYYSAIVQPLQERKTWLLK
jgi:hypothetical protein